ncbi:hypothetical protein GOODEAATRI_005506 [Goodea atripinnis]|uniref:Optineurin n=1 Tax=Goodea atripinnis TaxID=208336 RepID=A0ABV0MFB3_9TELE
MMNGDISRSPGQSGTLEETVQQMNILIQENRDLKEALRQTNLTMKERFEGLSLWKEKQRQERDFLENRLQEARRCMETLTLQNQELTKKLEAGGASGGCKVRTTPSCFIPAVQMEALRAQLARLQAEKNDLVALNSELQLKAEQGSQDDSFIEIIKVSDADVEGVTSTCGSERVRRPDLSMTSSRLENEEMTAASEVENLKSQMMTLFKDLQQAQSKLDEAEGMKKNLQDRCREVEQDVATLKAQLVEKQAVQSENDRLKLHLSSLQAQGQMEQKKADEERNNLAQLKDAYTKLFEDYNELKEEKIRKQSHMVERTLMEDLQQRLTAAEEALAVKQNKIDDMKQEIFQKEKELETISVFQAQVGTNVNKLLKACLFSLPLPCAEVYSSDFYAERAAREKLHEEKERLAAQLEYVKKQNTQLQQDMDSLGRYEVTQMTGTEWNQENIPEHACPKCSEILPDLDSLQIHIMDCIN